MIQSNFLHLVALNPDTVQGTVNEVEPGKWVALIAGGWWIGYGASRGKAIKKVTDSFNREWFRYGRTPREAVDAIPKSV